MGFLVDQLRAKVREHYLAKLPSDQAATLANRTLDDVLVVYGTWRSRFVAARLRKAHLSRELQSSQKYAQHRMVLDEIVRHIEAGDDLAPYISTGISVAHDEGGARKKPGSRRDRDLLVADWGIHHLHLSTKSGPRGFKERTSDLLLVVFTADDAYIIGIYPHGSWALLELLEIYVRNWPDAGTLAQSRYAIGLSQKYSDTDRFELRSAGVSGPVEIDGRVYVPPGQMTSGDPLRVVIKADNFMLRLRELEEVDDLTLVERLNEEARGTQSDGEWEPLVTNAGFGFVSNGVFLRVGAIPWE